MKTCAYCSAENPDDAVRCVNCGQSVTLEPPAEKPAPLHYDIKELSEADKQKDWITIVKCATLAEADMVRCVLQAAGVSVMIPDEFLMQAVSLPSGYGWVRVQVQPKDFETSKDLLSDPTAKT